MSYDYNDYHTFDQLYKMRQAEIERAIRLGLYVKHDGDFKKTRRKLAAPLLHLMKPLMWRKR
ncbi:hypothetical protein M3194_27880 [Paenibacillus glycanilyticus]|uniref:hypothetical protein n=1 Tax=Paenibacillus glycanilyticus TaxID=126569 RepID=UPI00203AE092|nr:hypothetical protein [Paenibacillus glycanilyticus]MCM3631137.1 hypothetical protein [Paenibacillus glycanilyticus]